MSANALKSTDLKDVSRYQVLFKNKNIHREFHSLLKEYGDPTKVNIRPNSDIIEIKWTRDTLLDRHHPWEEILLQDKNVTYNDPYPHSCFIQYKYYLPIIKNNEFINGDYSFDHSGGGKYYGVNKIYIPHYYPDYNDVNASDVAKELNGLADTVKYDIQTGILTINTFSSASAYAICNLAIQLIERYNYPGRAGVIDEYRSLEIMKKNNLLEKAITSVIPGSNNYRFDYPKYYRRIVSMYSNYTRIYRSIHF